MSRGGGASHSGALRGAGGGLERRGESLSGALIGNGMVRVVYLNSDGVKRERGDMVWGR